MNASKTSITLALTTILGSSGVALAADNPFAMQELDQGYQVAEAGAKAKDGKCGEGKCGAGATSGEKAAEGKCGAKADAKARDGKCGEGKCGAKTSTPADVVPQ